MNKNEILNRLKDEKGILADKYGVVNIGLFGSYAVSTENEESDIDIVVEFKSPKFDWLAGLTAYLESIFNRKVDIIRKGTNVNHRFLERIESEILYV